MQFGRVGLFEGVCADFVGALRATTGEEPVGIDRE